MNNHFSTSSFPFVRIVVPFTLGIIAYGIFPAITISVVAAGIGLTCGIAYFFSPKSLSGYLRPFLANASLFSLLACLGWLCALVHAPNKLTQAELNKEEHYLSFEIKEIRQQNITTELTGSAKIGEKNINLILVLKGNNYTLQHGDIIACRTKIRELKSPALPDVFDYASYMRNKGILYRAYITPADFTFVEHASTLPAKAAQFRDDVIRLIRDIDINNDAKNFAVAVFTGNREYISEETQQLFSESGLAHILAVSGLHTGIVIFIVSAVISSLIRDSRNRKARFFIILSAVWIYVLFTGLAPSAIRAAIMATFVFAAKNLLQKHSSLNALFASAFLILLFSPQSLYDIGFQLSFLSVAGILLFSDFLTFRTSYAVANYMLSSMAMTISAQIGTFVLTIFYFHSFPSCFLIANILVVPLLPVFMLLVLPAILLAAIGLNFIPLNFIIDFLYACIHFFPDIFRQILPPINEIRLDSLSAAFFSLAIFSFGFAIKLRLNKKILSLPAMLAVAGGISMAASVRAIPEKSIFVTDGYSSTNIIYCENRTAYILNSRNDTAEISQFVEHNRAFFFNRKIDKIHKITHENIRKKDLYISYPIVYALGKSYMFVEGNYKKYRLKNSFPVNYAIITNNYYNQLPDLFQYVTPDTIVIANEIYDTRRDTLIEFAKRNKIPLIAY